LEIQAQLNNIRKDKNMGQQSLTIMGLVVVLLGFILERSGVEIAPDRIQTTIEVIIQVGGILVAWYGRWRIGGVNILGRKR